MFSMKTGRPSKTIRILSAVFCLMMICVFTTGAKMDISRKKITLVLVDNFAGTESVKTINTRKATVGDFLKENRVTVGAYDDVNMESDDLLYDASKIVIREGRAFTLAADGKTEVATTTENTVEKALEENGIILGEDDIVTPARTAEIGKNMTVTVQRKEIVEETVTTAIPFETIEQPDNTLYVGTNKVITAGVEGAKETVYRVIREEGVEISRELISEKVTQMPVSEVKSVGTKAIPAPISKSTQAAATSNQTKTKDFSYSRKIEVTATAYDTSPGENGGYARTAYGLKPQFGVVAVDPKVIPLGTKLYIESSDGGKSWTYGYCIAGDTGGAIKGNRVDLCYNTQRECVNFGRRSATVYILD